MYERLTKRVKPDCLKPIPELYKEYAVTIKNEIVAFEGCFDNKDIYEDYRMALDRLCEIEDKIEQGKIVELPCEIGQTVYKVTYPYRAEPKVTEFIVCGFNYCRNAKRKMIMTLHLALKANRKLKHTAKLKDIYFTPEEANKKLKELENEQR